MKTINRLNREFFSQDFSEEEPYAEWLERYKTIACNYAQMENTIAVLSDMRDNASYVYYGGFSQILGMSRNRKEGRLPSIWEEEIFRLIHPDDGKKKSSGSFIRMICRASICRNSVFSIS